MTIMQVLVILFIFHRALSNPGEPVREPSRRSLR
jgi:hypothetical protein